MSEVYKTIPGNLYFSSFSVVNWYDVFIRREYQEILVDSILFCQKRKGLLLYSYCIMPSHLHWIASTNGKLNLGQVLQSFKSFTAVKIMNAIQQNPKESRREWLAKEFAYFGRMSPHKQDRQFWQHNYHPFELYTNSMIDQKINYIHNNPVEAGFVDQPEGWRLSSANPESPIKVMDL